VGAQFPADNDKGEVMDVRYSKAVEEVVAAIQALDLDPIKLKLMDAEEGQGWSREQVDRVETGYRRFLTLLAKYPDATIAPNKDIDKFWHGHILDTMKYAEDCENTFGYFLHHFPYFGMRGADDAAALADAGRETGELYEREFGEPMSANIAFCAKAGGEKSAFCAKAAGEKSAFCAKAATPAFCAKAAAPAFCAKAAKPAFCAKAAKPAFCAKAAKPAFCAKAEASAFCAKAANQTSAFCAKASGKVDLQTRPTLAKAA
jgi:hypothetical protein